MHEVSEATPRLPKLRTVLGLIILGLALWAWLYVADGATGGCDDGCSSRDGWAGDPDAAQWQVQLWLAWAGAVAAALTAIAWLLRRRLVALPLGILVTTLFATWYSIATHARFGP